MAFLLLNEIEAIHIDGIHSVWRALRELNPNADQGVSARSGWPMLAG